MICFTIRISLGGIEGREEEKKKPWLDTEGWKNIPFPSICGVTNTVTYCPGVYNHRLCCRHSACLMRQPVRNNETLKQIVLASEKRKRKMCGALTQSISSTLLTSLYSAPRAGSLQWNWGVQKCVVFSYKTRRKAQNSIYSQIFCL